MCDCFNSRGPQAHSVATIFSAVIFCMMCGVQKLPQSLKDSRSVLRSIHPVGFNGGMVRSPFFFKQ